MPCWGAVKSKDCKRVIYCLVLRCFSKKKLSILFSLFPFLVLFYSWFYLFLFFLFLRTNFVGLKTLKHWCFFFFIHFYFFPYNLHSLLFSTYSSNSLESRHVGLAILNLYPQRIFNLLKVHTYACRVSRYSRVAQPIDCTFHNQQV